MVLANCLTGASTTMLFAETAEQGGFSVTRLYSNAVYQLLQNLLIEASAACYSLVADGLIELRNGQERLGLRRVVCRDAAGEEYEYLTNRFDLDVLDVVRLYLYRWEIENFFKWIKRNLQIAHWYSECENGVLIQLYAALIAFLLLKFYTLKGHLAHSQHASLRRDFFWWLALHLFEPVTAEQLNAYLVATGFNGVLDTC
jgi:IS4 transposase